MNRQDMQKESNEKLIKQIKQAAWIIFAGNFMAAALFVAAYFYTMSVWLLLAALIIFLTGIAIFYIVYRFKTKLLKNMNPIRKVPNE
ncbi:MAG: hypothetical protein ACLFR2_07860 [Candidatus Kapaibacterium sp.]